MDRGEAYGRHSEDGAGHEPVQQELERVLKQGRDPALGDLQELQLALLGLLVPELRVEDVPGFREVAGPARAVVVDLLALGEKLEPVDGAVDPGARALRDLADAVLDRRARGFPSPRHGEADEARVVM